jgi:hypothetical protein
MMESALYSQISILVLFINEGNFTLLLLLGHFWAATSDAFRPVPSFTSADRG